MCIHILGHVLIWGSSNSKNGKIPGVKAILFQPLTLEHLPFIESCSMRAEGWGSERLELERH